MTEDKVTLEDMPSGTETTRIKKKIAPLIIISVAAATVLFSGYGLLHYRVSQTDDKIEKVLRELETKTVDEARFEAVVSKLLSPITKRLDNVEEKVVVLEEKTSNLNLDELKALKKELEDKISKIEKSQALLENMIKGQDSGKGASNVNTNMLTPEQRAALANSGAMVANNPQQNMGNNYVVANNPMVQPVMVAPNVSGMGEAIVDGTDIMPFKLVAIIDDATANIKINDRVYSLDIRTSIVQNRYDFVRLDAAKRMAIVKDTTLNQYYIVRVSQ